MDSYLYNKHIYHHQNIPMVNIYDQVQGKHIQYHYKKNLEGMKYQHIHIRSNAVL